MPLTYAELQQLLVKEEGELRSQLGSIQSEVREDGVGYSNHIADAASEVFEQARNVALLQQLRRSYEDVQRARRKFDDATYGICESCGALIDIPRLEALPSARHCVTCQTRLEGKR